MLRRTEAIVLKTIPYAEADLIVSFITQDYGLLHAFAKSPRKIKSRFGSSLEPLTHSKISFWGKEDSNLPRLTQSDIIRPFQTIRERTGCFFRIMENVELTLTLLPERETHRDVFHLFQEILARVEDFSGMEEWSGEEMKDLLWLLVTLYKIRFLDISGYGPAIRGCVRCSRTGYDFYISQGSVLCGACARGMDGPIRLSPGTIRLYETLRRWEVSKIERIRPSGLLMSELSALLDTHIQYTAARPMKTTALSLY
jgi:DNA repair protein RecO (recombination protein O)